MELSHLAAASQRQAFPRAVKCLQKSIWGKSMSLNYPPGGLEYALRIVDTEGPADLTSYERTQLATELVKASAILDIAKGLENISDELVAIARK